MDIYSAQVYVEKLLEFLKDIQTTSPPVYANSKRRYRKLAESCQEVISSISSILKEDFLSREDNEAEFDEQKADQVLLSKICSMENELSSLKKFLSPSSQSSEPSTMSKKDILKRYATVLQRCTYVKYGCCEVDDLTNLIWTWFEARFLKSPKVDHQFRYQLSRMPEWILSIVIAYSDAFRRDEANAFKKELKDWSSSLLKEGASVKYCVPYSIYSHMKSNNRICLASVVLWDVLCSGPFVGLCQEPKLLEEDRMFNMCSEQNPDELDRYKNYTLHPEILRECGFHEYEGGESN